MAKLWNNVRRSGNGVVLLNDKDQEVGVLKVSVAFNDEEKVLNKLVDILRKAEKPATFTAQL